MILPDNVDKNKIAAHVEHGVLSVELPKLPVQSNDGVVKQSRSNNVNLAH